MSLPMLPIGEQPRLCFGGLGAWNMGGRSELGCFTVHLFLTVHPRWLACDLSRKQRGAMWTERFSR